MKARRVFDDVSDRLETLTSLNRLEARGTLRIALKDAGLEAKSVQPDQLRVVIEKVLPTHLSDRGIADSLEVCRLLIASIAADATSTLDESPEAIFARLGTR